MKKLLFFSLILISFNAFSQLTVAPDGDNKKALVGESIGITNVSIEYSRPAVRGREGYIYGKLVPYGLNDLGFGTSKAAPWRAGANENTVISFSNKVTINGNALPAGKYGFFVITDPNECTLVFSKNATSWGSFYYEENEDALRIKVKPVVESTSTEWLKYEFTDQKPSSVNINLVWEKWRIPFTVEVDLHKIQMESFRRELRSDKGFTWNAFNQAARYTLNNNVELEQGLQWAENAISLPFIGQPNFNTLSTKAQILTRLGRTTEADTLMKKALPLGTMNEVHNYARQLLAAKKGRAAFDVFKMNYDKYPGTFTTNMGLARGYSAISDYKKALEFLNKALVQAPDPGNKVAIEKFQIRLKDGKDIN